MNSCAFTGHRPKSFPWKYNENASDCILLKEVLAAQIMALTVRGVTDFYSGMAQGVDYEKNKVMRSEILDAAQGSNSERNHFA